MDERHATRAVPPGGADPAPDAEDGLPPLQPPPPVGTHVPEVADEDEGEAFEMPPPPGEQMLWPGAEVPAAPSPSPSSAPAQSPAPSPAPWQPAVPPAAAERLPWQATPPEPAASPYDAPPPDPYEPPPAAGERRS